MADFKAMYYSLFNKVTDAVHILEEAQKMSESTYIDNDDPSISLIHPDPDNDDDPDKH
ncbi:MAG: hypothetical protein LBT32_06215 [Peptococcaceae bacterium]|jgi:hypothetical protein|nr:hypothetical protein [Peptococcaceae bacterium]